MTGTLASVFLLSHNKGAFAVDAIRSVLAQEHADLELWVLENSTDGVTRDLVCAATADDPRVSCEHIDLSPEQRAACYVPAWILNRYYPKACGKYIFYLSDDDLLDPACVGTCVKAMEAGQWDVCYFSHRHENYSAVTDSFVPVGELTADEPRGFGSEQPIVDSRIDGGQIVHSKTALDVVDWPWFPENPEPGVACHADGLFMQKLAWHHTFHPLPEYLGTARRTPMSLWSRSG